MLVEDQQTLVHMDEEVEVEEPTKASLLPLRFIARQQNLTTRFLSLTTLLNKTAEQAQ